MLARILDWAMPQPLHPGRPGLQHVPILLVAYACLLPRELSFEILGAALFPSRLMLIATLPFSIANLVRSPIRPSIIDACAGFAALWFIIALAMTTNVNIAFVSGGAAAIDYGLAYLLGRSSIRSAEDVRILLRYFMPGIGALFVVMAAESISHKMLMRPGIASLLNLPPPELFYRQRFGLLRATGPFPHPILGGVFLAGIVPLSWYLAHNHRWRILGCALGLGAIFSVSSTAMIGLAVGIGLIFLDITQNKSRLPLFPIIAAYLGLMLAMIAVLTEGNLVNFFIRNFTLESGSGYYRMLIWQFGGAEALANPWFGIGMRDWSRPEMMYNGTVDAYWLVNAMIYGFPSVVALGLVMIGAIAALLRAQRLLHAADTPVTKALICFIAIALLSGFTVHLWEAINSWIAILLGCAVSIGTQARFAPRPVWHVAQSTSAMPLALQPVAAG